MDVGRTMVFDYFLSKITDFFKKVLRITKKGITLQSFPMRMSVKGNRQERPEGLTRRNVIGVWRSWLAHLVWDQRVQCSSHCTPTKKRMTERHFGHPLFFVIHPATPDSPKDSGKGFGIRCKSMCLGIDIL